MTETTTIPDTDVLDLLCRLVDQSLVTMDEKTGRYGLTESVAAYGREKLSDCRAIEEMRGRHRDWYVEFTESAAAGLNGEDQADWLDRLDVDIGNIRLAMEWCDAEPDGTEAGLRMSGGLMRFWVLRAHVSEGRERYARMLTEEAVKRFPAAAATALHGAGNLAMVQADYPEARSYYERSLDIARQIGDRMREAGVLGNLGTIAQHDRDFELARDRFQQAMEIARELGNRRWVAVSLTCLGTVSLGLGSQPAALDYLEQAIQLYRELGDREGEANALNNLGGALRDSGDRERAAAVYEEALRINLEIDNRWEASFNLFNIGRFAMDAGLLDVAHEHFTRALEYAREIGGRAIIAVAFSHFALLAMHTGNHRRAARLSGAYSALEKAIGVPSNDSPAELDHDFGAVHQALGDDVYSHEVSVGRLMSLDAAIEYALAATYK